MTVASAELPELVPAEIPLEAWGERLLTGVGALLDGSMVRAMQWVVRNALLPDAMHASELRASAEGFLTGNLQRDPGRFFADLDAQARPIRVSSRFRRDLTGGVVLRRKLEIDYRPYAEFARGGADPTPARLEHWVHEPQATRATVLALHGFTMGQPRIDALALFASQWFQRGLDVALLTLPFHGRRTPSGARFSGERFASPDVGALAEAVRQAVHEVRCVANWLRDESGAAVGLLGLSLGGYISALLAALDDSWAFVVPMVPPACMGDLAWRFLPQDLGAAARTPVLSLQELRTAFRVHSPLTYALRTERERILIVAGRGDRIVPPEHPYALWRQWQHPGILWFSGSHLAPFQRRRIVTAVAEHLQHLGVL